MEENGKIIIMGTFPETNWGGLEVSMITGDHNGAYLMYRRNWGENCCDKWHRSKIGFSGKGMYCTMYKRRYYFDEMSPTDNGMRRLQF